MDTYTTSKYLKRADLIKYLKKNSITSVFHYVPLHSSKFGKKLELLSFKCQIQIMLVELLRLPMHTNIKLSHIKKISKTISDFFKVKSSTI